MQQSSTISAGENNGTQIEDVTSTFERMSTTGGGGGVSSVTGNTVNANTLVNEELHVVENDKSPKSETMPTISSQAAVVVNTTSAQENSQLLANNTSSTINPDVTIVTNSGSPLRVSPIHQVTIFS